MKLLIAATALVLSASLFSCKSSSGDGAKSFCDTVCLMDSLKFMGESKLQPSVFISARDCKADSIEWTYKGMGTARKTAMAYLLRDGIRIKKDFIRCVFRDTAAAYLLFNDCVNGRGYQMIFPFSKGQNTSLKSSGINNFDPKFSVADNLLVNTDRGNIFVEDMTTGKKAMMTFGKGIDINYDDIHTYIDSVNVTNERIWVKLKMDNEWKELEKKITLQ